ncbi:MAG: DUF1893 domain-containing protein [Erysipelotrichaceae bacterium]|jgi:hypothetical protein|nr:DUF1893 domain-containing protein [Erysipelotrichaceae bacterium]
MNYQVEAVAKERVRNGTATIVIANEVEILATSNSSGIRGSIKLFEADWNQYQGRLVFDKVVGKAAAMIFIKAKLRYVYGKVMSEQAYDLLKKANIEVAYDSLPSIIMNRFCTGMCPIENSVKDIDDIELGLKAIYKTLDALMNKK